MGLLVTLRTDASTSYFRELMLEMFDVFQPDEVLICSGFFQEQKKYKDKTGKIYTENFKISTHPAPNPGKTLFQALENVDKISIVGIQEAPYNSDKFWNESLENFTNNLGSTFKGVHKDMKLYKRKKGKWHAKVMIFRKNNISKAAIIGSSNFTSPAYGEDPTSSFNIEADTYLYDAEDNSTMLKKVENIQSTQTGNCIIVGNYIKAENGGRSEIETIERYYKHITSIISNKKEFVCTVIK